jgi:hypothetical protein
VKTIKYETSPGALAAYLGSRPAATLMADLYTITFAGAINGGAPLYFTTADVDVTVPYISGTVTYSSKLLYLDQLANKAYGHWKVGVDVDTWQVICAPSPQATIGGQPFLSAVRAGALDGAVIEVDRAFIDNRAGAPQAPSSLSPLGVINIFTGRTAEIDFGRSNAVISINSHLELLNVSVPRNLFQAGCRWRVYDPGCTLNRADFQTTGSVASGTSSNLVSVTLSGAILGSGTLALGYVLMTSGANAGFQRLVRGWTPGSPASLTLIAPFPYPLVAADTLLVFPGCDRQLGTCNAFNNALNFGGEPLIPAPETAI